MLMLLVAVSTQTGAWRSSRCVLLSCIDSFAAHSPVSVIFTSGL